MRLISYSQQVFVSIWKSSKLLLAIVLAHYLLTKILLAEAMVMSVALFNFELLGLLKVFKITF